MTIKDTFLKVFKRKAKADVDYPVNDVVNHQKHVAHDFDDNEVKVLVTDSTVSNTKKAHEIILNNAAFKTQVEGILETPASQKVIGELSRHIQDWLNTHNKATCDRVANGLARMYTAQHLKPGSYAMTDEEVAMMLFQDLTGNTSSNLVNEGSMIYHSYMGVAERTKVMWTEYLHGITTRKTEQPYNFNKDDLGEFKAKLAKYLFDNYPSGYYHGGVERFAIAAEVIIGYDIRYNRNASVEDIKPLADSVYEAITGGSFTSFSNLDPIQRDIFFASVINAADMWTTYSNSPIALEEATPTDVSKEMISMAGKIGTHKTLHPNIEVVGSYGFLIQGTIEDVEEAKEIVSVARDVYTIITDRRELDNCSAEVRQRYINAIVGIKRNIQVLNITSKYHLWIYLRNDLQLAQVYNAVQDASVDKCLDVFYVKHNQKPQPSDVVDKVKQMEVDLIDNYNTVKKIHDKVHEDELIELLLPAVEDHFSRFVSSTRKLRQNNKHKAIAKAFIDNMALSHKFDVCLKMRQAFLKDVNVRDDVKHINELRKEYRDTLLSAYDILTTIKDNYYDSKKAPMIPQDPIKKTDHPNIFVSDTDIGISGSETDNEDAKHIIETAKKVYAALHHVDESQFATMRDTIRIEYINAMVNIKKHLSNPTNVTNYSSDPHYRSLCYTLAMIIKLNTSLSWDIQAKVGTILMKAFAEGHTEKFSVINTLASNIYIGSTGALSESLKDAGTNAVMKFTEAAKYVASHYFNEADIDNINGETLKLVDPVAAILWDTTNNAIPISLDTILIAKGIQNGLDYLHGRYYKTVPAWAFASDIRTKKDSLMDKTEFINHLSRSIYVIMVGPNNATLYDRLGDAPLNNWVDNLINTVFTDPNGYLLGINAIASLNASLNEIWSNNKNTIAMSFNQNSVISSRCEKAVGDSIQYLSDTFGNDRPKWWVAPPTKKDDNPMEVIHEAIKKEEPMQQLHHVPDELVHTLRNALHVEFKHIERYNWQYLTDAVKKDISAAVTAFLVNYRTPDASPNGRAHKLGVATKMQSVITTFDTPELNHEEVKNVTHIALHNFVVKMCDVVEKWKRDYPGTFVYKEPTPVKDDSQKHIEECAQLLWKEITFNRTPGAYTNLSVAIQKLYENAASVAINYIKSRGDDFDQTKYSAVVNELLTELCFDGKYSTYTDLNAVGKTKYISAVAQVHTYLTNLEKTKTTTVILSTAPAMVDKIAELLYVSDTNPKTNAYKAYYQTQAKLILEFMMKEFATTDLIGRNEMVKILADVYRAEGTYCDYRTWSELPEDVKKQLLEKADKRINQVAQK